jgi:hypothetical protein
MKSRRLEVKSEKRWDMACTAASSFICAECDSVMIRFLRKICLLFQPPARSGHGIGELKKGKFKIF